MFNTVIDKVFGTRHERAMRRLMPQVQQTGTWESRLKDLSDDDLRAKTAEFKARYEKGESLDAMLPEAFAVCRLGGQRALGMRHFDVQLIGGMVLHSGKIAEMKTGEGKTLTATLALYLNALAGKGAHLVTVNDYLASRDAEWMGQLYGFLGLTTGVVTHDMGPDSSARKRAAYAADITYGTNNEFGFDYLRDNMKLRRSDEVQRPLFYAIVDEVDSILIDEARTPLIISGQARLAQEIYIRVNRIVSELRRDEHFQVDEEHRSVTLTDAGVDQIEARLGVDNLYEPVNIEFLHHIHKALDAHNLYKKGEQYLVIEGKIVIVDEFTGRTMEGRRWSDGLHQAIEAKEGVTIQNEQVTLATITYQNYFRMYSKLAGMTGTAETEAEEFDATYKLDVVVIPTNKPVVRKDQGDLVYRTEREKFTAIVDQILECHEKGQPVLVGTTSVDKSEVISKVLQKRGVEHSVLNAKLHGREAGIVAQAGRRGAVTISTNMAGRGTDILLGGRPESLAQEVAPDTTSSEYEVALGRFKELCAKEKQEVLAAGGLFILGTERHESRRIDNQLRGRAGRQGDPGESRFFLSLEDELMRRFGADRIQGLMQRLGMEEGIPIEAGMVSRSIENAQKRVEGRNFDIRKHLLEYDDVMDVQRKTIYALRQRVIEGEDMRALILDVLDSALAGVLDQHCAESVRPDEWDLAGLPDALQRQFGIEISRDELPEGRRGIERVTWARLEARFQEKIDALEPIAEAHNAASRGQEGHEDRTAEWYFCDIAREAYLRELDRSWQDHLRAMTALRDAVRLHAYAQKDPKQIYKKEGFDLFQALRSAIYENVARVVMLMKVNTEASLGAATQLRAKAPADLAPAGAGPAPAPPRPTGAGGLGAAAAAVAEAARAARNVELPKIGRNDPCWCGSGEKYKKCHMKTDSERAVQLRVPVAPSTAAQAPPENAPTEPPGDTPAASIIDDKPPKKGLSII
ncbi:MAG: preprotein translocase subunit SecA [Myxococcales bacterium]|nr:preprotein translocase subunit SecA [Myxococcales bacterium]MCB9531264.1 preprotein translocase subunit SecA [Myxococcales bacterium]